MTVVQVEPRPVGRPKAKPGTVRIMPSGVVRLSADLCTVKTYGLKIDKEKGQLIICRGGKHKLYFSRLSARSGLLWVGVDVWTMLGLDPKEVAGEYAARQVDGCSVVDLEEK